MPWARLNDKANGSAKLLALSDAAWRLWGCGLIYCQDNLTDGFIPKYAIHTFGVRAKGAALNKAIAELCVSLVPGKGPLWHLFDTGYTVHDYLDWNESREAVIRERERSKGRVERFRLRLSQVQPVTPLQTAFETPNETRSEHRSYTGSTTTKDQDQKEQRRSRAAMHPPEDNPKVLVVLAHAVFDDVDAGNVPAGDVREELKLRAAKANLVYDADRIRKALDSAEHQRSIT